MKVTHHVKRYGNAKFGEPILWAAAVIVKNWVAVDQARYPGLMRLSTSCPAAEANFASKREADAWGTQRALEIRSTLP
jgi:hypothetical protein